MQKNTRLIATVLFSCVLTACSSFDDLMNSEPVDYKSTVRGEPLALPPDLSQVQINPQYSINDGRASASAYDKALAEAQKNSKVGSKVLPQDSGIQVMRSGNVRWLQVSLDADVVYPEIISFWTNEGFTINRDNPTAGIIETDWAENRAKIPGNFLRRTLGSIVEMVMDSGERERFTTRLERVNGKTEVFISHERMVETQMDKDGTTFKWLPAEEDQNLNAVMLSRLMTHLGASKQQAAQAVEQAAPVNNTYKADFVQGEVALAFNSSRDMAYRQVGKALSASGFTIDSSDASSGVYVVRYLDTDTGEKRKSGNIITRLWGDNGNLVPVPYTIVVGGDTKQSVVVVRDKEGKLDRSDTAKRILSVIRDRL